MAVRRSPRWFAARFWVRERLPLYVAGAGVLLWIAGLGLACYVLFALALGLSP